MDKLFSIGIMSVLAVKDREALRVFQEHMSGEKMAQRDWTENYLCAQTQALMCLYGKTSAIKRAALVTDLRGTEEAVKMCEQNFHPKAHLKNHGGLIDLLNYNTSKTTSGWIVQAAALSGMLRVEKQFDKGDPMGLAIFNLVRAHFNLADANRLDERVADSLNLAKAIAESNTAVLKDLEIWQRCAELFCETLLPDMSLTKTLNESKLMEEHVSKARPLRKNTLNSSPAPKQSHATFNKKMDEEKLKNKKLRKEPDFGRKKITKREDRKLQNMVKSVWDDQLHDQLETEISFLVDNMSVSKLEE